MKTLLRIEFRKEPQREAVAWFIGGDDPSLWLEEIALWQVEMASLVLSVVARPEVIRGPRSSSTGLCGVLVTADVPVQPTRTRLARPWGCVANRLYLPVEAAIQPAVDSQEIATLLPQDEQLAWHPHAGLLGFETDSLLRISDLLSPPVESPTEWGRASPGPAMASRLHSLTADELPGADVAIRGGQDDIGTESDGIESLKDLPPGPNETRSGAVRKAFDDFRKAIADKVQDFTSKAPRSAEKRTWIDRLDDWANRVLDSSILQKRQEALNRLMSLLDRDPEAGLRKAIPFGEDESHRGYSTPGSRLHDRDIDFHLPGQSGGIPGDAWAIPWEIQHQLQTKYRKLANREVHLGRHRRAAYIYGNLLGDYHSAARTLEEGGHYLEAAALHQDRLGQPLEAARCLERGGLLHQAIEIYEQHSWFEEAAKLHQKLDQMDEAQDCWTRAVKQARKDHNYLRAAKLTREELNDTDEALTILRSGWNLSIQSQECLAEWFRLRGELGQHEQAATEAKALSQQRLSPDRAQELVRVLAGVTSSYPDGTVRLQSADSARVLASEQIGRGLVNQTALLNSLREVDGSDRLLARDCDRWRQHNSQPARRSASTPVRIDEIASWQTGRLEQMVVARSSRSLFLAGYQAPASDRLHASRFAWDKLLCGTGGMLVADDEISYQLAVPLRPSLVVSEPDSAMLLTPGRKSFDWKNRVIRGNPSCWRRMPGWLDSAGTIAVAGDLGRQIWQIVRSESDICLTCSTLDGSPVSSCSLASILDDPVAAHMLTQVEDLSELNIALIAAHKRCFLRIGNNVYIFGPGTSTDTIQVDSTIYDMAMSPDGAPAELAIATGRGVYVYPDGQWRYPDILMTGLRRPRVGYTCDGLLVGADGDSCIVEDTQGTQLARLEWSHREFPVAVVPTSMPVTFAVIFADGLVRLMHVR